MSPEQLGTLGSVLGGLMLFFALPVLTRIGSVAMLLICTIAGAMFFQFLGRAIAHVVGAVLWPGLETTGDLLAAGLPLRPVDQAISGFFIAFALIATLMRRNEG